MKKFRSKKRKKHRFIKLSLFLIVLYIFIHFIFNFLTNIKVDNKKLISFSLNNSNYNMIFDDVINFLKNINITNVLSLSINRDQHTSSEGDDIDLANYIDDPNYEIINNPKVYIYNTHQLEAYDNIDNKNYDIVPTVQMASYLLKDKLNNYNIPTIVEMGSISDLLNTNGWNYSYSYKASRYFLLDAIEKYKNLDLIIDLHRDSISHESSTIEYNGKKYAKILFVIGTDYDTYSNNLEIANRLDNMLKKEIPTISRGVITKGGKGVNGVYNQDLNNKIILIECGGNENSLDEIINTINVLSKVIKEYLGG